MSKRENPLDSCTTYVLLKHVGLCNVKMLEGQTKSNKICKDSFASIIPLSKRAALKKSLTEHIYNFWKGLSEPGNARKDPRVSE